MVLFLLFIIVLKRYTFTGNGVEFITETGPEMGEIDVYIDGELKTTIDCSSPENILYQQTVYRNAGLKFEYPVGGSEYQGRHTIKLVKKSGQAMIVDAFKILTYRICRRIRRN